MTEATHIDFWQVHGWLFLFCIAVFPRITMLVTGIAFRFMAFTNPWGVLAWVGWVIAPHFVVAVLATIFYGSTNPVLCVIAWLVAFTGTASEGRVATRSRH